MTTATTHRTVDQSDANSGSSRLRGTLAVLAMVLAGLATMSAVVTWSAEDSLYDPEIMVAAFGDLPQDPERAEALGDWLADEMVEGLAVEERLTAALPFGAALLSGPLTDGVERAAAMTAREVIQTELFADMWTAALPLAHESMVAVLRGTDGGAISASDGVVTVDISGAIFAAYERISDVLPDIAQDGLVARVTGLEPGEAKAAFGNFLTSVVPDNMGSLVLLESEALGTVQGWAVQLERLVWLSAMAALVAAATAVAISNRPRLALIATSLVVAAAAVLGLAAVTGAEWALINAFADLPAAGSDLRLGMVLSAWQLFMVGIIGVGGGIGVTAVVIRRRPERWQPARGAAGN